MPQKHLFLFYFVLDVWTGLGAGPDLPRGRGYFGEQLPAHCMVYEISDMRRLSSRSICFYFSLSGSFPYVPSLPTMFLLGLFSI